MAYGGTIYPLHHSTCEYPITSPPGATIRVLITSEGVFRPLVQWLILNRNRHKSNTWQRTTVRAVGFFFDYYQQTRSLYEVGTDYSKVLSDFAECLLRGTIHDGEDPLGLYWPKQGWDVVDRMIQAITAFSDWCVIEFGAQQVNPWRLANWGERMAAFRAWDKQNRASLLVHLADRQAAWQSAANVREIDVHKKPFIASREAPPFFPFEHFDRLLEEGFRKPGVPDHAPFHRRYHIRDMLIALLQGAGGLRESEPMHLYVDDVFEHEGRALVRVHHPQESMTEYVNPLTGEIERIRREDYLNILGALPRNSDQPARRAGWKNPALVKDGGFLYFQVEWFPRFYGELFFSLYRIYLHSVRPRSMWPHLFLTNDGITTGEPYTLAQYERKLAAAIHRIGLVTRKADGTTSHGLRHMYGQRLKDAGIDTRIIQWCMHHKSMESTLIYTPPVSDQIQAALDTAKFESPASRHLMETLRA